MTENKRYFKKEQGDEYYIFDSINITEEELDEELDYNTLVYSMGGYEILNRLNEQDAQIKYFKIKLEKERGAAQKYKDFKEWFRTEKFKAKKDHCWYDSSVLFREFEEYYKEKHQREENIKNIIISNLKVNEFYGRQ